MTPGRGAHAWAWPLPSWGVGHGRCSPIAWTLKRGGEWAPLLRSEVAAQMCWSLAACFPKQQPNFVCSHVRFKEIEPIQTFEGGWARSCWRRCSRGSRSMADYLPPSSHPAAGCPSWKCGAQVWTHRPRCQNPPPGTSPKRGNKQCNLLPDGLFGCDVTLTCSRKRWSSGWLRGFTLASNKGMKMFSSISWKLASCFFVR